MIQENECIKLPETQEEIDHAEKFCSKLGFLGCIGSADCTHIIWDRVPVAFVSRHTGKEKKPTLAFQIISSRAKKILSCSHAYPGCDNDKTIARFNNSI